LVFGFWFLVSGCQPTTLIRIPHCFSKKTFASLRGSSASLRETKRSAHFCEVSAVSAGNKTGQGGERETSKP